MAYIERSLYIYWLYTESPPILHFLFVLTAYFYFFSVIQIQLDIFKNFCVLTPLMGSNITPKHVQNVKIFHTIIYIAGCGIHYILIFKVGDVEFGKLVWVNLWYRYLVTVFTIISTVIAIGVTSFQMYLLRAYVKGLVDVDKQDAQEIKQSFNRLLFYVSLMIPFDILGIILYVIGMLNPYTQFGIALLQMANACAAYHTLPLVLITGQVKVLLLVGIRSERKTDIVQTELFQIKEGASNIDYYGFQNQ
ncbi:hypothetical protein EDD86DRAFT_199564 [Gorgonomyces haynaldii]|nr:hypothetical protein EDD86DRAFT_199564 [Gorgonomyces haynaldii]